MANVPEQIVVPVPVVVVVLVLVLVLVQEALVVPAAVLLVMDQAVDQEEHVQMVKPKSLYRGQQEVILVVEMDVLLLLVRRFMLWQTK